MLYKQQGRKSMEITTFVLVAIAVILLVIALLRDRQLALDGINVAGKTMWTNLPTLLASLLIAGLVQVLIPKEIITTWLGPQAGIKSVFIGSLVGGLVPGSPYVVFPIVASLYKAGAGLGAVIGFVTAWSL